MLPYQKLVLLSMLLSSLTLVGCSGGGSSGDVARSDEGGLDPVVDVDPDAVPVAGQDSDLAPVDSLPVVDSGSDPVPVENSDPDPSPVVVGGAQPDEEVGQIQLVDGESLTELLSIVEGVELDLGELINTFNFTVILAEREAVGSVAVKLSGCASVDRVENFPPYTVGVEGDDFPTLQPGNCLIEATSYALPDGLGEAGETIAVNFSVVGGESQSTVPPVTVGALFYEVLLNWDTPMMRSDGTALSTDDLASYQIRSSSVLDGEEGVFLIGDTEATSYLLTDLSAGTYEFRIAAIDVDGISSGFSEALVVSVGN